MFCTFLTLTSASINDKRHYLTQMRCPPRDRATIVDTPSSDNIRHF